MKKSKNPKLKEGDRIILIHMDGESLDPGTKGLVMGIEKVPHFSPNDLGYAYKVKWYDEDEDNPISALSLLPETDSWMYDFDNIQETFRFDDKDNENSTEEEYNFVSLFKKSDLKELLDYIELIRQSSLVNMMDSAPFFGSGSEYIRKFVDLHYYGKEMDENKEEIVEKMINKADYIRNMFINAGINDVERQNMSITPQNVERSMKKLIKRAFIQFVLYKRGYFNK
jgi:hypothetical protein